MYSTMHPSDKACLRDGDILVPAFACYTDGRDHMYVLVKCPRCRERHSERRGLFDWCCRMRHTTCGTPLVVRVLHNTPVFRSVQEMEQWVAKSYK
jgi:hypothetical protein